MAALSHLVGQTLGHYRILEQIGAGGMGVVYRARDDQLERDVAVKVLPPGTLTSDNARRRFRKEALMLAKLNHANVETVYEFGSSADTDFLVTEYIPGITLDAKLAAGGLPEKEVAQLGMQLTAGLAAAHRQGVIHRDLKPGNLRVAPDRQLKILDFGLARLSAPEADMGRTVSLSESQQITGTLPYMAPEQLRGETTDARSDIWAAGVVLYEMATGRRPFPECMAPRLTDAILHQVPPPPRAQNARISQDLERIILKCLEKEPDDRYQSVTELGVDLRRLITPKTPAAFSQSPWLARRWSAVAIPVAVASVLLTFGLLSWQPWRSGTISAGRIESLAVLPLANLSGDLGQGYFVDGMTEELITALAQISTLRVISRTSVMPYKEGNKPLSQIARELNVDAVVEGSVRRSGDHVRVTAQLINASTDRHLWAKSYEGDLRDVLVLQHDVALAIANEVGGKLNPQQQPGFASVSMRTAGASPVNPEAYEAYLRGSSYMDSGDFQKGIDYFNQAIRVDPDYAPPYAKLASAYYELTFFNLVAPGIAFSKMKEAATKALEKDERLPEGHGALAWVKLHHDWDFPGAEREFKRALELNPNDADIHHEYSHYLMAMGRIEESVEESNRAVELDPIDTSLTSCLCWHRYSAHQYNESVEQALKAIQMEPNLDWTHVILGWDYEQQGKFDEAIPEFQRAANLSGGGEFALAALGHAFAAAGKRKEADEVLAKLKEKGKHGYISPLDVAIIYTGLGDKEKALQWLQKAFEERSTFLIYSKWEPRLDPLRSDPQFRNLMLRIGLPP